MSNTKAKIITVDNFRYDEAKVSKNEKKIEIAEDYYFKYGSSNDLNLNITLKDFKQNSNNQLFFVDSKKIDDDQLIISTSRFKKDDGEYYRVEVGNFIGSFDYNDRRVEIKSRFGETFLKRMLNFANDVYLDDVDIAGKNRKNNDFDYSKFVIYYLFVQRLKKAFLLGLPKSYISKRYHETTLKGKVDINSFIRKDIPFRGEISSITRELTEVQEIVDVLYKAIEQIEKDMPTLLESILNIRVYLKQHRVKKQIASEYVKRALNSKALSNPIYHDYKRVLEYAKMIITIGKIEQKDSAEDKTFGFLTDVSKLFELYLFNLLKFHLKDWEVIHEDELMVYDGLFYKRHLYPDIVMKKDNKIVVFDAKYKRMHFKSSDQYGAGDLDRTDFFQIHTYMSYYKNQGKDVILGGLLYPIEDDCKEEKCHSGNWLGSKDGRFIVDGIEIKSNQDNLKDSEKNFIKRIKELLS